VLSSLTIHTNVFEMVGRHGNLVYLLFTSFFWSIALVTCVCFGCRVIDIRGDLELEGVEICYKDCIEEVWCNELIKYMVESVWCISNFLNCQIDLSQYIFNRLWVHITLQVLLRKNSCDMWMMKEEILLQWLDLMERFFFLWKHQMEIIFDAKEL